jgi:hypothetical protein
LNVRTRLVMIADAATTSRMTLNTAVLMMNRVLIFIVARSSG